MLWIYHIQNSADTGIRIDHEQFCCSVFNPRLDELFKVWFAYWIWAVQQKYDVHWWRAFGYWLVTCAFLNATWWKYYLGIKDKRISGNLALRIKETVKVLENIKVIIQTLSWPVIYYWGGGVAREKGSLFCLQHINKFFVPSPQ